MTVKLPDVPPTANPGLNEYMQALKRQSSDLNDRIAALEKSLGGASGGGLSFANELQIATNTTLTAAQAGSEIIFVADNLTAIMPSVASVPLGSTITFISRGINCMVKPPAGDLFVFAAATTGTSIIMGQGEWLTLTAELAGYWHISNASQASVHPPQFDSSGRFASTQWATRKGLQNSGSYNFAANATLTAVHAGARVQCNADNMVVTLPLASTVVVGSYIWFYGGGNWITVQPQGSDVLYKGTGTGPMQIMLGENLILMSFGGGGWVADGGSAQLQYGRGLSGGSNHQRFPDGSMFQCGFVSVVSATTWTTYNYPVPFVSNVAAITGNVGAGGNAGSLYFSPLSVSQFQVYSTIANTNVYWMAFGQ